MELPDLKGKAAIVTGSSSGIGAAVALGLARRGANVVVNYSRSEAEAETVAAAVKSAGAEVRVVKGNVALDADCKRLAAAALDAWGRIDILVNCAGITKFVGHGDLDGLSAEDFANIYAVNVIGPFQMIRACRTALAAHGEGAVVNISSIAGIEGVGSSVAYAASKGALNTMTLSLARALAPAIRVNAICPGFVSTSWFSKSFPPEVLEKVLAGQKESTPLKRVADGAEIAKSVIFMASPDSRHITGETLLVDGGMRLTITVRGRSSA